VLAAIEAVRPDVFVPSHWTDAVVSFRSAILQRTRALLPSPAAFAAISDKAKLLEHCDSLQIPTPRQLDPDTAASWLGTHPNARIVIKPRRDVGGGTGLHFVEDPNGVASAYERVHETYGGAVITEYVPGPVTNLIALHLMFDDESRLIGSFVLRKLRIWPAEKGITVAAVSTHETHFVEQVVPLFEKLGWRGPAEAELKVDERDGRAKMLEVNPRFSGAVHFPIACGVNLPALLCRAACGERLPRVRSPTYADGVRYIDAARFSTAVLVELRRARSGRYGVLASALSEFRGPRVPSVHSLSDPAPLLAKLCQGLQRSDPKPAVTPRTEPQPAQGPSDDA
jgi:predicted ATP-grasp superfamily ATP-dependent carboligase